MEYCCCILPLIIETHTWGHICWEERICNKSDILVVEDECHFIFHWSLDTNIRDQILHDVIKFNKMNEVDNIKMQMFMSKQFVSYLAKLFLK